MTALGNPDVTAQMEEAFWASIGTLSCPPNADALCRHCGIELSAHQTTEGPGIEPHPSIAVCIDDVALLTKRVRWNRFELADGQSLDCPHVITCDGCGTGVCGEHTDDVQTCSESSSTLHHPACVDQCDDCVRAYAESCAEDRAVEQWKGCW